MDGLVMCGGRGTRLEDDGDKPLFEVGDRPMIASVLSALEGSKVESMYAVTSPHTPATRQYVLEESARSDVSVIDGSGGGYVEDLAAALETVSPPVLTVAADLPLLEASLLDRLLEIYDEMAPDGDRSLTVCVPTSLKEVLGTSQDTTLEQQGRSVTPAGVNVVGRSEEECRYVSHDVRLAVNVNRPEDGELAAQLLCNSHS